MSLQRRIAAITRATAAPAGWWLAGGAIDKSVYKAVYQAKGAASYEASKVNLVNPGTYNASEVLSSVPWNDVDGWCGDSTNYLDTGIIPNGDNYGIVLRFSNLPGFGEKPFAGANMGGGSNRIELGRVAWNFEFIYGNNTATSSLADSGVIAVQRGKAYVNGVPTSFTESSLTDFTRSIWLMCSHYEYALGLSTVDLQAVAILQAQLTDAQHVALYEKLAVL